MRRSALLLLLLAGCRPASVPASVAAALSMPAAATAEDLARDEATRRFGPGLHVARTRVLGATRLVLLEPDVPVLDERVCVELREGASGLEVVRVTGRHEPASARLLESAPRGALLVRTESGLRAARVVDRPDRRDWVDLESGAVLSTRPNVVAGHALGLAYDENPTATPRAPRPLADLELVDASGRHAVTDASGQHALAGPVSLARGLSGPRLRVFRTKITAGPFPQLVAAPELALSFTGPEDFTLAPPEGELGASELAAFHLVTRFREHLRATYPAFSGALDRRLAVLVDETGPAANFQSFAQTYDGESFPGALRFGIANGHPMSRESLVVSHEFFHSVASVFADLGGLAIDEALADYFACVADEDPRWCERLGPGFFRDLSGATGQLVYPRDAGPSFESHRVGNIVGQALWKARTDAEARAAGGRLAVDQAVAAAVLRFDRATTGATVEAIRETIVAADLDVNAGANAALLDRAFFEHGIGPAPAPRTPSAPRPLSVTNAASFRAGELARGSIATLFAAGLPSSPRVTVTDAKGAARSATVFHASATQINFLVPDACAPGPAKVEVPSFVAAPWVGTATIVERAPGVFTTDGTSAAANVGPGWAALYGTGLRFAKGVTARVGGQPAAVLFAGPQPSYAGLDQVNVALPPGPGPFTVVLSADGAEANAVLVK